LPVAVLPSRPRLCGAGGIGLAEEIAAFGAEAGGIREARRLDLSDLARRRLSGELDADGAVAADRHRLGALRDRDLRRDRIAFRGDERSRRVELEGAGAGVRRVTVRQGHL